MGKGNTAPQRTCREAGTAAAGTELGKLFKSAVEVVEAPAAPRRVAVVAQRHNDEGRGEELVMATTRPGRRRAGVSSLSRAGGGSDGGAPPAAGTVVTVKIVMRRKDAEALAARLHAQNARERKARMAELKRELRAGDGASPASCRAVTRGSPRLPPVPENQC